jgi:hypothetical protein
MNVKMGPLKKSHHGAKIIAKLKGTLGFEDRHRHDGGQDADTNERQTVYSGTFFIEAGEKGKLSLVNQSKPSLLRSIDARASLSQTVK